MSRYIYVQTYGKYVRHHLETLHPISACPAALGSGRTAHINRSMLLKSLSSAGTATPAVDIEKYSYYFYLPVMRYYRGNSAGCFRQGSMTFLSEADKADIKHRELNRGMPLFCIIPLNTKAGYKGQSRRYEAERTRQSDRINIE